MLEGINVKKTTRNLVLFSFIFFCLFGIFRLYSLEMVRLRIMLIVVDVVLFSCIIFLRKYYTRNDGDKYSSIYKIRYISLCVASIFVLFFIFLV